MAILPHQQFWFQVRTTAAQAALVWSALSIRGEYFLAIYTSIALISYPFWSFISIRRALAIVNSCIVFANDDSFAQSICTKDLASWRQSMMALGFYRLGKRWFGFRRFKKHQCSFATGAKAHHLDQNWQSLAGKAQHSDHWANFANLTCQDVNHHD